MRCRGRSRGGCEGWRPRGVVIVPVVVAADADATAGPALGDLVASRISWHFVDDVDDREWLAREEVVPLTWGAAVFEGDQ